MKLIVLILLSLAFLQLQGKNKELPLKKGMIITESVIIKKGIYIISADSSGQVITISGNNITVDFNGAELKGSDDQQWPNQFHGTGILIKGGKNLILKNAVINGFKIAVLARDAQHLTIQGCNLSYNYRQKLHSNRLREDVSDWMSYHHNEKDEWLRYGAGIYLRKCDNVIIKENIISGGQCALMLTACNDGFISGNNFSYNSGLGIGMYRSSRNKVINNKLDFNVRGYSHGIFNRGQDSAGILVFEQCNENVFTENSVTHSGDGFFLWAGQHTMDTGEGGCNDNYVYKNDFSYAPTNGVEITFSRNIIKDNIIKECDNGIWGGYSFNTVISGNIFGKNTVGIAIEHGQKNIIHQNVFGEDKTAIKLWARKSQPTDWGYAQKRDTRSSDYKIVGNSFTKNHIGLQATLTDSIRLARNSFNSVDIKLKIDSSVNIDSGGVNINVFNDAIKKFPSQSIAKQRDLYAARLLHPGRKEIRITNWGPYDYLYPIIWLSKVDSNGKMWFDVLGPKGSWKIKNVDGARNISRNYGTFPDSFTAEKDGNNLSIEATYVGEKFISQFGKLHSANKPYSFSYSSFEPSVSWDVKWYRWDIDHDPNRNYERFKNLLSTVPIKSETVNKLDYTWWGEIGKKLPADSFATIATGVLEVPKGKYDLGVTADDLVKVFIDGKLIIDFWDATKYVNDDDAHHSAIMDLDGNKHNIRVEHVENAGFATLIFTLEPLAGVN
jgi:parallel beta-helix repeat protein